MKRTTYFIRVIAAILLAIAPCHISAQGSVGTPKGAFSVSPSGAAIYSVSIDMPEPANGLKPDIAIAYNSQAGNGIVGYGCNITGISVITRGARDIYHDGQASGTDNTIYDAFYLDGKRIILDHPEGDPYTTVTLHEGSGYVWFEVVTPDGTTHKYGDAAKSRLSYTMRDNTACTAAWYITQTTDRLGNSIDYSYEDFNSNVVYPLAITYNTNTHDATYKTYRLLFQYESRPDVQDSYMGGTLCTMDRRLKKIITQKSSDHAAYRSYEMAYASSIDGSGKKYSRLSSITEKNGSNESLPPVMFEWAGLPHFSVESAAAPITLKSYASVNDRQFVCGDLNGDGVSDVIEKVKYTTYSYFLNGDSISADEFFSSTGISGRIQGGRRNGIAEADSTTEIRIGDDTYQSRSSLWQEVNIYPSCVNHVGQASFGLPLSIPIGPDKECGSWGHVNCGAFAVDMYGSGSCNLAIPFLSVGTDNSSLVQIWVNEMLQQSADILYYQACGSVFPLITVTDFDNDGRHELFILEKTGQNGFYQYAFEYADESNAIRETTATIALPHDPTYVFVADYDNNGLQDIMILYEGGYKVYWGTGSHELFYLDYAEYSLSGKPKYAWEGDFNGDGCPDYLLTYTNNPNWYVAYGRGNGVLEKVSIGNIGLYDTGASQDNDKMTALVYDFDGDGLTDFVVADTQYGLLTKTYTKWYRSVGESFTLLKTATSNKPDDGMAGRYSVGDFDGDGYPELMNYGYDCFNGNNANVSPTAHVYPNPLHAEANGKVVAVHDGFDRVSLPVYTSLATGGVYAKGTGATYPVADIAIPLHVVKSASTGNGAAGTSTQSYEYGGLKVHLQGKGLLGFSTTSVTDVNSGTVTTSSVDAWNTTFYVPAHTTKTTEVGGHTATEEVTMGLAGNYTNNKLAYPSEIVSEDFEGNVTRTVNTFSAAYGKPTAQTTYYGSGTGMFKKTEYGLYVKKGGAWLPQRVTHKQKHIDDGDEFSLTTKYTYDEQGLPTQVFENFGITGKEVTTDYTYDSCGRKLTERTTGTGFPGITYTYGYTNGRLTSVTDDTTPVHTVWSYNDWGDLTAEVDLTETSSPQVNHYTYDGWNRQISTTDPTGITASTSWGWGDTQAKQYYVEEQSDSLSWSRTWYDSCGREVETESRGPLGVSISTQTEYDDRGQVAGTTSTIGDLTTWEEHEYDGLGRVTRTTTSSGSNSTFSYSGRTVTENRNGRTYSKTVDAWGNTVTATDPVSSVSYSYFSNGKPESATSEGSSVTMAYDAVGNQTSLTDPDAGTMTYTYDAAGHVVTQTDARGKVTENEYDSWGRLSKTTIDGEETTYTYGTTGRDRLRLKREQVGDNSIDYTHDPYGRILTETRTIDSTAVLSFSYHYNGKGLVDRVTYPGGVTAIYGYDQYGNRKWMAVNGTQLWHLTDYTGRTTQAQVGSSLTTYSVLDDNGLMASVGVRRNQNLLHGMTFTHDGVTGNLLERTGMFSYGEEFTYDDLDRLTSYTAQNGTKDITYAGNGNILSHTDRGTFTYNSSKPHAVETVGSVTHPVLSQAMGCGFTYNGFGKVSSINLSGMSQMSWRRLDFSYGPDRERWKTVQTMRGGLIPGPITTLAIPESSVNYVHTTNLYAGDYERIDGTSYYYLDGGVIYVKPATSAGQAYYALTDHLGSYVRLYTMAGDSVLIASYDPWGNCTTTKNTLSFRRGFTGHEHLTTYGVINMNGRMYDPTVGRFLAPDNFVQMPDFSQSFNRYSYCLNNPLKYTDPSGEFLHLVVGALMGGMFNIIMNGTNIHNFWQGLGYFGIGAAAGAISAGIASGVNVAMTGGTFTSGFVGTATGISSTGFISGALTGAASGFAGAFISNTGNAWMEGESFTNGIWNGIKGGSISALIGGAVGGLMGGIDALSKKTNFWTGNASLDMSQAYSAFGPVIGEKTITGKYVGKFENVNVYESKMLGDASNGGIRGATLPGRGIIVSKGVYTRCNDYRLALLQHEYGHILQSKIVGLKAYYRVIARESFLSATFTSQEAHANFWTETWANYLSKNYFGADWFGYKISGYPAQDISIFNLNRLKKVGSLITSLIL